MSLLLMLHTLSGLHRCPNKIVIFLSNFMMLYSPCTQKFSGIIFSSAFSVCDHEYKLKIAHCSDWCRTFCYIDAHMSKVWKHNKLHKRFLLCLITTVVRRKKNLLLLTKAFRFPLVNKQLIHFASLFGTKSLSQ